MWAILDSYPKIGAPTHFEGSDTRRAPRRGAGRGQRLRRGLRLLCDARVLSAAVACAHQGGTEAGARGRGRLDLDLKQRHVRRAVRGGLGAELPRQQPAVFHCGAERARADLPSHIFALKVG